MPAVNLWGLTRFIQYTRLGTYSCLGKFVMCLLSVAYIATLVTRL